MTTLTLRNCRPHLMLAAIATTVMTLSLPPAALAQSAADAPAMMGAPDAVKEERRAAMKEKWEAMTPEQKEAHKAEKKAKWEAMSPEEKAAIKEKRKAKWDAMSEEERAAAKAKRKEKYENMTPEQKEKFKERRQEHRADKAAE